ncbi:MAG: ATP-binding protein [Alphaproteobacteria bacterium]
MELIPGVRGTVPGTQISYLSDPDGALTLDQAVGAYRAGRAAPIAGETADFGNVFGTYWLFAPLANTGPEPGDWHVATRAPFVPEIAIDLVLDNGRVTRSLASSVESPFSDRPVPHRFLISAPMRLASGEHGLLVIMFRAGGASGMPFTLESPNSLRELLVEDTAISWAFYAFSIAAILFFVLFSLAVRATTGLLYAGLFAVSLLLQAQIDGLTFQLLWPQSPNWNGVAALVLWLGVCGVGFFVAGVQRSSLRPSPRFRRAANALALVSLLAMVLVPYVAPGILLIGGYLLFALMIAAHAAALAPQVMRPGGRGLVAMAGAIVVAAGTAVLTGLFLAGVQLPAVLLFNAHRILYLVISLATMFTLAGFVMQLRRDHESALEREVEAARRDAALNRELFESEKNYARARDLAARRQRQLASATHDIRQPLASLRLSLDALAGTRDAAVRAQLREAFDYLEGLTGTYLAEARTGSQPAEDDPLEPKPERSEPYVLSLITGTIDQMFREEAVSKGLDFRVAGSDALTDVPALPLMRLVGNLVSNAVKYTVEGGVAVTAGEAADGRFIAVEDTGPGMSADALADLRRPGRKGAGSEGEGLGLAIADDVAEGLGIRIEVDSVPGRGTRFRLLLPVTEGAHS